MKRIIVMCDLEVGGERIIKTHRKSFVVLKALNDQDGLCRTLKSQYQKNSIANFVDSGSRGATGVIRCRKRQWSEKTQELVQ